MFAILAIAGPVHSAGFLETGPRMEILKVADMRWQGDNRFTCEGNPVVKNLNRCGKCGRNSLPWGLLPQGIQLKNDIDTGIQT